MYRIPVIVSHSIESVLLILNHSIKRLISPEMILATVLYVKFTGKMTLNPFENISDCDIVLRNSVKLVGVI